MTPAEQLAAARRNIVGPYLPAKVEWLREWRGPAEFLLAGDGWRSGVVYGVTHTGYCHGVIWIEEDPSLESSGFAFSNVRLDVHRPEVRDHLVRLGCPAEVRDVPAAVWCWGMDVLVFGVLPMWRRVNHPAKPLERFADLDNRSEAYRGGWTVRADGRNLVRSSLDNTAGKEPAELCDECDLAALNAGCILRVEGGWLVPLRGGGIGFFPEVSRDE